MDNAGIHKSKLVKKMFQQWETCLAFNSPDTPTFNPAELVIGLLKNKVRIMYYEDDIELIEKVVSSF